MVSPKRRLYSTLLACGLVYAILVGVPIADPSARAKMVEAFGDHPFGLPVVIVVTLGISILFLPAPWFFWHAMPVMQEAIHAGRGVGMFRVVGWLVTDAIRSPRLRVSAWITLAGLGYFFAVMVGWIIYADSRGI